jgi:hypothetical protein
VPGRDGKGGCPSPLYDYEREHGTKDVKAPPGSSSTIEAAFREGYASGYQDGADQSGGYEVDRAVAQFTSPAKEKP